MAGKGDKQRPTDHSAYGANFDAIFGTKIRGTNHDLIIVDELTERPHQIISDGIDTHKGEYWYKCNKCGATDWIASYGTMTQLDFYNKPCKA